MTKWICRKNCAGLTCTACVSGDSRITQCLLTQGWPTQWERVDEPKGMCHAHEVNLEELAGTLKALKERMDKFERGPTVWVTYTNRVTDLENQVAALSKSMRTHRHSTTPAQGGD